MPRKKKSLLEEMTNQQSAAIRSTSSTKQYKLICQLRTNTRPLALDRQTTTATESGTTATTKHAILLSTYHHLRVAQLNNRRNLHNATLEAPGTQPLAMLLCGFSWRSYRNHYYLSSSFSHACPCHVYVYPCMYVYLPKFNKQTHYYNPYRSTMGIFYSNILICFGTKYDANLEYLAKFYFINLSKHQDSKNNWSVPFKVHFFARFSLGRRPSNKVI